MPQKGSTDLFRLIRSLSRTEKAYFKKFAERHVIGEKNNYLKLFDAIDRQPVYDEAKLLKEEKYIKQLPYLKNYLFDLIMKSMGVYHADTSLETTIENSILRVRILYNRGLYDMSLKLLLKTKEHCIRYQFFLDAVKLIALERRIMLESGNKLGNKKKYDELHRQELKFLHNDQLISIYAGLEDEIAFKAWELEKKGISPLPADFESTMHHELLKQERKEFPLRARILFNNVHSVYNRHIQQMEKHLHFASEHKRLKLEEYKIFGDVLKYITCLNNYFLSCFYLKKYKEAARVLDEMAGLPVRSLKEEEAVYSRYLLLGAGLRIVQGKFIEGAKFLKEHTQVRERIWPIMKPSRKVILLMNMINITFANKDYKECLRLINHISTADMVKIRPAFRCHCILLSIMVHIELKNFDLLPYLIKSAKRFYTTHQLLKPLEKTMLALFTEVAKSGKTDPALLRTTKQKLEKIFESPIYQDTIATYFDYFSWLESRILNISFVEAAKRKLIN